MHEPHADVPQHTDSTQEPLAQSPPFLQLAPSGAPALELLELVELLELPELAPELEEPPVLELDALVDELEEPLAPLLALELVAALPPPPHVTRSPQSDDRW